MNQLEKLIEQFEIENREEAFIDLNSGVRSYAPEFMLWLASRPTCGIEQRKFLDKIEKEGQYFNGDAVRVNQSILYGISFGVNLKKVIKGE
jgi:hypothetical protein